MIEAIAFDTSRFVKRLTESGFTEEQAATLAEEQVALLNSNLNSNLATKSGTDALRPATRADIEMIQISINGLRRDNCAAIAAKSDMAKWFLAALLTQVGLIVTLVTLL